MTDEETQTEEQQETEGGQDEEASKAEDSKERYEKAEQKIRDLEEQDEPPTDLKDWPDDEAKYITYGGVEGEQSYDEGPTKKLGPHDLERHEDGSVSIEGEKVDNPDEYKGEPVPGGPTDPNAPKLAGEEEQEEKNSGDDDSGR